MTQYADGMMAHYTPYHSTKTNPAPFYECLPPFKRSNVKDELRALTKFFNPAMRNLSFDDRIKELVKMRLSFFVPRHRDILLATAIDQALYARYTSVPFQDPEHYLPTVKTGVSAAECIGMFGRAGAGKSRSFEYTLARFPSFIRHSIYEHNGQKHILETKKSVPILWIKCPTGGGTIGLANVLTQRFNEITRSSYARVSDIAAAEERIGGIGRTGEVGAIAIDEIGNVLGHGAHKKQILDFMTTIAGDLAIPLILTGDENAIELYEAVLHACRRVAGLPIWSGMSLGAEFTDWLKDVLEFHITKEPWPYSDKLAEFLQGYSLGLPSNVIAIILMAEQIAMEHEREYVRQSDLEEAVKSRLTMLSGGLANVKQQKAEKAQAKKVLKRNLQIKTGEANVPQVPSLDLEKVRALPPLPPFDHLKGTKAE